MDVMIGARIRLYRSRTGTSQEDLAKRCDVTFQQIQKYEKGANRVSCSRLIVIAKALGVHPTVLLLGEADVPASPDTSGRYTAIALMRIYERLNLEQRDALRRIAKTMLPPDEAC